MTQLELFPCPHDGEVVVFENHCLTGDVFVCWDCKNRIDHNRQLWTKGWDDLVGPDGKKNQ